MHVLLVDDNADITGMLSLLLEAQGYRVSTAGTGAEALRCLEAQGADVVLCDLGLPDIDGAELARRLRAQPAWAELPRGGRSAELRLCCCFRVVNPFPLPGNGVGPVHRRPDRRGAVEGAPVGPW